jgi:hypothetical protein
MKLPNGERASVSDEKLYGFLVNIDHPTQPGHDELFERLLGIGREMPKRCARHCSTRRRSAMRRPAARRRSARNTRCDFR